MSAETTPVFLVGSGRSGTRSIYKLLSGLPEIEIHHEYVCTHVQPEAARFFMGFVDSADISKKLLEWHGAAIHYSTARYWVDCSNKLSWLIAPLFELFPHARFVHLTRDGRKVAGSFFHKLGPEIYDDASVAILQAWIRRRDLPAPPPEKRYWWNIPQPGQPFYEEFPKFDQFQRICYHWREVIRVIGEELSCIPARQQLTVKLEELTTNRETLRKFLDFFEVEYEEHFFEFLQRPQNVFFPMDFKLTGEQMAQFAAITGDTMQRLGYDIESPAYEVRY